jgi:hypothetical protein
MGYGEENNRLDVPQYKGRLQRLHALSSISRGHC